MSGARTVVRLEAEQAPEGGCAMTVMTFYHPLSYIIDCESERSEAGTVFAPGFGVLITICRNPQQVLLRIRLLLQTYVCIRMSTSLPSVTLCHARHVIRICPCSALPTANGVSKEGLGWGRWGGFTQRWRMIQRRGSHFSHERCC